MGRKRGPKTLWMWKSSYQRRRCTKRLKPAQVNGLQEADAFARRLGYHLNTFVTISWGLTSLDDHDFEVEKLKKRLLEFRRRIGKWLKAYKLELYWVYVHENPSGNVHTHFLLHIPPTIASQFAAAIDFIAGARSVAAVDVQPRNKPGNFQNRLTYMCKGTDPVTARRLRFNFSADQGEITCKRCGWTENLGQRARKIVK